MSIRVALHHRTRYAFDRLVALSPHEVRLRPAPHNRTPLLGYSLTVKPQEHFIHWQQDAYGNWVARLVFTKTARELEITVDLIADMTVINPFDFFVEPTSEHLPFAYTAQAQIELAPYLVAEPADATLVAWLASARERVARTGDNTVEFLIWLNQQLAHHIRYLVRTEPGVQTPEETLRLGYGSCRDSSWLLVQALRLLGFAARFVSGYLIQLAADVKPLDGPSGPVRDFTDLHAWAEVYLPGAGWIGFDPTSGLLAGEGHIPLAATALPSSAAPVSGFTDPCESTLEFAMTVTRVHEDPRVTKPYSDQQWRDIDALGHHVDAQLAAADVRLTHGGEPTFVSIDNMDGPEWNTTALSPEKLELAEALAWRLKQRFAPGALLMQTQGKWYPGEPLPRWALPILWRVDGTPLWRNERLLERESSSSAFNFEHAERLAHRLADALGLSATDLITAYEDPLPAISLEQRLPENFDPLAVPLVDFDDRSRLARQLMRGLGAPVALVLPLQPSRPPRATDTASTYHSQWESSPWPLRRERLYLVPGDSPAGLRLPLASLPEVLPEDADPDFDRDPFAARGKLHDPALARELNRAATPPQKPAPSALVRTALVVEARAGRVQLFLPPLKHLEDFVELIARIEEVALVLDLPVRIEGYPPPVDARLRVLAITPDPGVIEVNVHPAATWPELMETITGLYEEARLTRLGTEKFMLDGRHTGTGGGNHVTLGGASPAHSPFLRRPDLLKSLIAYWQNHPCLSYLFVGQFVGPTSQSPRVDEGRDDNLYELEIAFEQLETKLEGRDTTANSASAHPWLVDRLLRNLLVDLTGNTHRAEFCIDKLYSPSGPTGRLGLVELRAFEMPPHAQMSLAQMLLLRALVLRFWREPYRGRLVRWGTQLHDRWMLPHFISQDMRDVVRELRDAGFEFRDEWFAPFIEFRFPRYGTVASDGITLELRQAIEPWHVLGEEIAGNAIARYVDSSVERLQVKVTGMTDARHVITCNTRRVPLAPTGVPGEFVGGVRFKAWNPPSALHPSIAVQSPLVFDLVDTWFGGADQARSLGGCTYHVVHAGGRNYQGFPVNANEAEARRFARFWSHGHTPGTLTLAAEQSNPAFPLTLDLRRQSR